MDLYDTSESFDWLFETLEDSPKAVQSFIWTTAKGDKIPLSKMETRHICNCIRLLESKLMYKWGDSEKRLRFLESWHQIFQSELEQRRTGKLEASYSL